MEWYIKHIILKEPKFLSLVPQAIFDDVTKIQKSGPFRSFSGLRQNFFREIYYKKIYFSSSALNWCVGLHMSAD